jgi:tetratricopeptide (TPR) repeat protein
MGLKTAFIFLITLLGSLTTFSQTLSLDSGTTRAVIVGISDYQNEKIPDLRFADKDAQAFSEFLQSPAGGGLEAEQIKTLLNEQATNAQIAAALEWLIEVSKEGDKTIIYFSGHGDVETKTMFQLGYLLGWDSPAQTYAIGAFPLSYLQAIISTLSVQNKAEVTVITDACRAGKLAGSAVGGAQITNANLSKQFANEVKILSCQPDEFSLEGEQWGGGRGVFSYHLVDGLYGLADNNSDLTVNLFEIGRYLEDKVSNETSPHSQFPMIVGSKTTTLTRVDEAILNALKEQKNKETPTLARVESKGFEEMILVDLDSTWQKKYRQFTVAVAEGHLLEAPTGKPVAYDLYLELVKAAELQGLHGTMKRNLAAALQDDAQQAINAYLEANPTELSKRYAAETNYDRYPKYLRKAAEILGEENFYYPYVMAKLYYFEGLQLRLEADNKKENASYQEAIDRQKEALKYQEYAPYVLNELGVLHTRLKLSDKAIAYYDKAIELAPEWGLPYVNLCLEYFYSNEQAKAVEVGDKALERMPNYPQLYNLLGWVNANFGGAYSDRENWERLGVELNEDFAYSYLQTDIKSERNLRLKRTLELLKKAIQLDSNYAAAHSNLGIVYHQTSQLDKAEFHTKKSIQLDSTNSFAYKVLGTVYRLQDKCAEGEIAYQKSIQMLLMEENIEFAAHGYAALGELYQSCFEDEDKALSTYQKGLELDPKHGYPHQGCSEIYAARKDFQKAEWHQLKYLEFYAYSPRSYYDTGRFYQQMNRYEDAEKMYLMAIKMQADYVRAIRNLMNLYREIGDIKAAYEWQEKLSEIAPKDPEIYIDLGKTAYLFKEPAKAEKHFQTAIDLDTLSHWNLNHIGWFYKNHGEYDLAKKYLERCIATKKDIYHPYANLAEFYFSFGQYKESIEILDEGLMNNPDQETLQEQKTILSYFAFSSEQSKLIFEEAANKKPAFLKAWEFFEQMRQEEYAKATQTWKEFEKDIGTWYFVHTYLGALVQNGDMEEAIKLMNKTPIYSLSYQLITTYPLFEPLRKEPAYQSYMRSKFPERNEGLDSSEFKKLDGLYFSENCLVLGEFYEGEGENERARFLLEKAIELEPNSFSDESAVSLAEVHLKLNNWEKAQKICPENLMSEDANQNLAYGKLYYKLNRFDRAESHFQKYIQLTKHPRRAQDIGFFYYLNSDIRPTEKYLQKALEINPDYFGPYIGLSLLHFAHRDYEKALQWIDKGVQRFPNEVILKSVSAFILAHSDTPSEGIQAFEALDSLQPGSAKIGTCLQLLANGDYEAAAKARKEIKETLPFQMIPMLDIAYLRMLVAQKDFPTAMRVIYENTYSTFTYGILQNDPALVPLRETEEFKVYMQSNYPGKVNE